MNDDDLADFSNYNPAANTVVGYSDSDLADFSNYKPDANQVPEDLADYSNFKPPADGRYITPEPVKGWGEFHKGFVDRWEIGSSSISKGILGAQLGVSDLEFDKAKKKLETKQLVKAQTDTEEYRNHNGFQELAGLKIGASDVLGGWLIEQLPTFAAMGAGALGAAAVAATSPVSIPLGTAALVGGGLVGGIVMGGNMIYDLMERGVDRDTARGAGIWAGVTGGILEAIGFKGLEKGAEVAMHAALNSPSFKSALPHFVKSVAASYGQEMATEEVQSISDSAVKYISTRVTNAKVLPFTMEEAYNDALQTAIKTTPVAIKTSVTGTVVGGLVGHIARETNAATDAMVQSAQEARNTQIEAASVTESQLAGGQARARKKSRKFLNAGQNQHASVNIALTNLDEAQNELKNAATPDDQAVGRLAVEEAKGLLQESRLAARLTEVEDALTDFNLQESISLRRTELKGHINSMVQAHAEAKAADVNEKALSKISDVISEMRKEVQQLNDFEKLSDADLLEKLREMKSEIKSSADKLKHDLAISAIKHRMSKRQKAINQIDAQIAEQTERLPEELAQYGDSQLKRPYAVEDSEGVISISPEQSRNERRKSQLVEQQEIDQLTLDLVQEHLIDKDDLNAVARKAPRVPISRLDAILSMASKRIDKAASLGAKEQVAATRAVKRIIDRVIDTSRLPKADKLSLKDGLKSVVTVENLRSTFNQIEGRIRETFEKRRHEAAFADLKTMVSSIHVDKRERSKFPGVEEALSAFADFIKDPERAETVRAELDQLIQSGEALDHKQLAEQTILDTWFSSGSADVKKMGADQVLAILDAMSDLKIEGRQAALNKILDAQEKKRASIEQVANALTTKNDKELSEFDIASNWRKVTAESLEAPWRSWEGLMNLITRRGTMSDLRQVFDLKKASADYWREREKWSNRWHELVIAVVPARKFQKYRVQWESSGPSVTFTVSENGTARVNQIASINNEAVVADASKLVEGKYANPTVWELIQIRNYLLDEDQDAHSRLSKGNGFTYPGEVTIGESTLESIEIALNEMNEDVLKIADAMRTWYQDFSVVVDDVSVRRFGRHIPMNRTYGGPLLSDMLPSNRFAEVFRMSTTRPGSILARQGGEKAVQIRNALDVLNDHLHKFSHEVAYHDFEETSRAVFSDASIRTNIERNFGNKTLKIIDKYIQDLIEGSYHAYSTASDTFGWVRRMAFSKYLGLKPSQYFKQLTSFVYGLQSVGPKAMIEGYATFLSDPQKWIEVMNKSPLLKARGQQMDPDYKGGGIPWFVLPHVAKLVAEGKPKGRSLAFEAYENTVLRFLAVGDVHAVYLSSFPVLIKVLKETGSEEKAIAAFERAFETTQSSGAIEELPALFRGSTFERMLTVFSQQPTRQAEMIAVAWDGYINDPTATKLSHVIRVASVSWLGAIMYNMLGALILSALPYVDDEDKERKLNSALATSLLGPYAGVAFWGTAVLPIALSGIELVTDTKLNINEPQFLLTDFIGKSQKVTRKWFTFGQELEAENLVDAMVETYRLFFPLPETSDHLLNKSAR